MEFKLKYSGSALGYVWSVAKPLALFTMLYLVFGRVFKLGAISHYYPLSLLIGIVLFSFFADATTSACSRSSSARICCGSCRSRGSSSRSRATSAPRSRSASTSSSSPCSSPGTGSSPQLDWLLLVPLLLELYVFIARRRAHPRGALRPASRHRPGLGALAAAPLLRVADHLPGRLPAARGRRSSPSSTRSPRCCRTSERSSSTPDLRAEHDHRSDVVRQRSGQADPDRDRARRPSRSASRSSGARRRGSRSASDHGRAIEVAGVSKSFRLPHQQRTTLKEHFLHPFHATTYERSRRSTTSRSRSTAASSSASSARTAAARARC